MKKLLTFLMMSVLAIGVGWAETTVTKTIAEIATANSWSDATVYSTFSLDSYITVSCTSGNNTGKYFASDDTWRMYANENAVVTVSAAGNYTINSITFTFAVKDNGTLNYGNNSINSASPVAVSGNSASFSVSQSSGNKGKVFISEISVTYTDSDTPTVSHTITVSGGAADMDEAFAGQIVTLTPNIPEGKVVDWDQTTVTPSSVIINQSDYTFTMPNEAVTIEFAFKDDPNAGKLFYESWSKTSGSGGNDGLWSGSIASSTVTSDINGWTYEKQGGADNCVKLGTGSAQGSATTPNISVENNKVYSLSFRAGAWSGDQTQLKLSASGATLYEDASCIVELTSVTMNDASFKDFTVYLKTSSTTLTITWQGKQASKSRFFLDEVLLEETVAPAVATPVIVGETPFLTSTEVTITCATDNATIYYTTDNSTPSNESNEYTVPFEITETTTVKAIAYDANNNASSVASKEFVKTPSVSTVAEIVELADGSTFVFNGDLVVSGQNGEYLYAQDETGGMLLYGTAPSYDKCDVIPSGFSAKKTTFKGAPELKEMTNMDEATETAQLTAEAISPDQLTVANAFKYAVIQGATIENNTIIVGDKTVDIYNRFNVEVPTDGKIYDVYGVTGWFEGAQFMPLVFEAEAEAEYYLVGSFNTYVDENNETQWIQQALNYKFTLTDDGRYVLTGVTCPDNVEFKILKVKGSQTTWCGGPADGNVYGIHGGWYKDIPLTIGGGKNYKIDAAGTFNFTLTIDDNYGNKFTVIKSPVVIRGSFDGWTADGVGMTADEAGWTTTQQLEEYAEFGFRDGWGNWHGGNGKLIASTDLNTPLSMGDGGNFKMEETGNYTLTVNSDLTTLVATKILAPHNIVVESGIEGGTIAIKDDKTTAVVGETVTILVAPNENYVLENLVVTNSNTQQAIEVTEDYTFVMPDADVTVTASFKVNPIVEVMFDYRKDAEFAQDNGTEMEISEKEGISITFDAAGNTQNSPKWYTSSNGNARVYVDNTITIDGGANYIEKVEFNFEGNYSLSTPTTSVGNYSDGTWTLGSDKGVLTADKTARIAYIIVYVDKEKQVVQSPVITGETPFLETTTVTITCATEGAEIRYTLNGQDPTAESIIYTEPFTINEAVTVKAIAFKNGNSSSIASKAFEQIPIVATIADYLALDDNTTFVFTGDAVVTYQNGSNTWIKDETGYALIYASGQPEYSNGDVIPAGWGGKKMTYNNVPEITNPTGLESATETSEAIPVVKTVADITNDDVNAYYKINDIILSANTDNFNIVDGETELAGYNKFSITMPEDVEGKSFNVVGVITIYNNKPEFYIISCEEILQPVVLEGVAFTAERQWATWFGEEALALPENVTAYVVTGINDAGTAVEVESVNYIPANTGVLLYSTTATESVSAMPAEAGESVTSLLQGGPATVNNAYVLYNNQFILAQDGTTVGAHRCYLPASASTQGAPRLLIGDPGTVTGIEDLRYDSNGKPVGYYDLTGRYVGTSLNGKRGIFITSDGKKVVR